MGVRPGVSIVQRSTPPPRSAPTDTGVWHVVGLTDSGPLTPTLITSIADYERKYGPRVSYSILYDALDVFFREGGSRAIVSRVVGPAAVNGSLELDDAGAAVSLVASALGPSDSSNAITVGVRAGGAAGTFQVYVVVGGEEVESSPDLADTASAALWSKGSNYIRLTQGASENDPAVAAPAALAGGNDDREAITDTDWQEALDRISSDLGTGQVSAPGRSTAAAHVQLLDHAMANRRTAILDAPNTSTQATLTTAISSARTGSQRFGGMFAPWDVAPGVVAGTERTVPPSARIAGTIARNDALGEGPATPAAGDLGEARYVTGLSQDAWDDATRSALNAAGINVSRVMFGGVRTYGWRSAVDGVADPDWVNLGSVRLYMAIAANAASIMEGFLFDKIDGQGKKLGEVAGALTGLLMDYYSTGDLYGTTPDDAFFVDLGNQVNTPETLANNELRAVLGAKFSPFAEFARIEIVKRPITEGVS